MKPICKINSIGDKFWRLNDLLHREDGPAFEGANGDKFWYLNGKAHREDGPAVEYANGAKYWCINGKYHREDGPAVEYAGGYKEWYYQDREIHCKDNEEYCKIIKLIIFL